jgi:hypothetical protein
MATARKLIYRTRPATAPFQIEAFGAEGDKDVLARDEAFAESIAVAHAKALSRDYGYVEVRRNGAATPAFRFRDGAFSL